MDSDKKDKIDQGRGGKMKLGKAETGETKIRIDQGIFNREERQA